MRTLLIAGLASLWCSAVMGAEPIEPHPLSAEKQAMLTATFQDRVDRMSKLITDEPEVSEYYSSRGDGRFFLGRFDEAVADYERMVELKPDLATSHWRRGIAYFYAGRPKDAARQFEIYHTFDDVDRENGIWRFFSQYRASGAEKAREGLLKYRKDDREPFPAVYRLFEGKTKAADILEDIQQAELTREQREMRLFYAQLYIGLNYAVEEKPEQARAHLKEAVANTWGPTAGYGPTYMWHVGRVHYDLLRQKAEKGAAVKVPKDSPK